MSFLENVDRKKLQQILLITLAVLVAIALILLLVIIINSISSGMTALNDYTVTDKDYNTGSLILADEDHEYSYTFTDSELEILGAYRDANLEKDAEGKSINKYYLNHQSRMKMAKNVAAAAHNMLVAAEGAVKKDDILIAYTYGHNNADNQEYNTAALMMLTNYDGGALKEEYRAWLDANCAKYGFVESFEDGYRYVGIPHAKYMTEKELTLAAYIEYLKKNTSADKALEIKDGNTTYSVYYVACNLGDEIKIPDGATVSGTNEGGIVVTAKK